MICLLGALLNLCNLNLFTFALLKTHLKENLRKKYKDKVSGKYVKSGGLEILTAHKMVEVLERLNCEVASQDLSLIYVGWKC